ncbi:hypothetical protein SCHPADRAFT_909630 [Schizopora paradoxa]|uniref:Uncharacterized protein n=1 Tax=Schizopora paradoxa TaxID=27342 RepID=A0A0H2R655_9AGAM|nr:hypothetical protein SCHPADRAFT_909630 [Schizopora paradoxa]
MFVVFAALTSMFTFAIGSPAANPDAEAQAPGPLDFVTEVLEIVALAEALNGTNATTGSFSTSISF